MSHRSAKSACECVWMSVWCLFLLMSIIIYSVIIYEHEREDWFARNKTVCNVSQNPFFQ